MADALCGPSNPLQTFQKQTSVDRTLQQDRLAARQPQAETFRSLPGRNAGILDAEFEAFRAGHPLEVPYLEPQLFPHNDPATSFQPNVQQQPPVSSDWASDFQNMTLEGVRSSPIPQFQFHQHAPLQRSKPTGWHEDFMRQQNQSSQLPLHLQQEKARGRVYRFPNGVQYTEYPPLPEQKQPERQGDDVYDEAAFERAFENARSDMRHQQHGTQLDQDLYRTEEAGAKLKSPEGDFEYSSWYIGSDRVLDKAEEGKTKTNEDPDADELARTAGQLLENVKGDQSRKFQESNFFSLMRQLRDKEVRVEGDKFVDVSIPSSIV